jgi:phenylpropionate dioxygenase-like ring-hydroxylating dioxygenase large terminal subunit
MPDHETLMSYATRLADLITVKSSDRAPAPYLVSTESYLDRGRWQTEIDKLFKSRPILLALSTELSEPGSFISTELLNTPILLSRSADGQVHLFFNVCRHRGALVSRESCGTTHNFVCPYHGWSYSTNGSLVGVPSEPLFGKVNRAEHGLVELPVAERHGLIFGILDKKAEMDIDDWLGGFSSELADLRLENRHVIWTSQFPGPNWKICKDGFIETYHFPVLHKNTVNLKSIPNVMAVDIWDQHARVMYPRRTLAEAMTSPRHEWEPRKLVAVIHMLFPNIMIAEGWGEYALLTQIIPGENPNESICIQKLLSHSPANSEEERLDAKELASYYGSVTEEEDYPIDFEQQRGIGSGANEYLTFGAHEIGLHHFHAWVDYFIGETTSAPVIEFVDQR